MCWLLSGATLLYAVQFGKKDQACLKGHLWGGSQACGRHEGPAMAVRTLSFLHVKRSGQLSRNAARTPLLQARLGRS